MRQSAPVVKLTEEKKMKTVLYSKIRPAIGQNEADIVKKAHALGHELVKYNGWYNDGLGASGNHGPRWEEARANGKILREIQDACEIAYADGSYDQPHIMQTKTH